MPASGTRNIIFVLRRLVERTTEKQKDAYVYVCFDTVKHESLTELLRYNDIDPQDVKLLANLYWNRQPDEKHNRQISVSMSIKQGFV